MHVLPKQLMRKKGIKTSSFYYFYDDNIKYVQTHHNFVETGIVKSLFSHINSSDYNFW